MVFVHKDLDSPETGNKQIDDDCGPMCQGYINSATYSLLSGLQYPYSELKAYCWKFYTKHENPVIIWLFLYLVKYF